MKSPDFYRNDQYKEYYKILRFFMKISALWPYQQLREKCFYLVLTIVLVESIAVGEIWEIINVWPDMNQIIDCLPNIFISVCIAAEYIGILYNSNKLKGCLDRIAQDWRQMSSNVELDLLKAYTVQGQKHAKAYLIYMTITGLMFLSQPFLATIAATSDNSTSILSTIPYRVEFGIDLTKYYYEILLYCYVTVASHMGILCAMTLIYILFIQHTCGLFAIVGYKLKHLGEANSLEISQNIEKSDDRNYWIALECLRRHIQAIEFAENVEGTFSTSLLCVLGIHMIGIAVTGIQVLLHLDDVTEAVRYVCLAMSILIQLFWQCWQAQLVLDYSNVPYECVVEAEWYRTSTRCKKILILIMIRSSRPCQITAAGMITLSIETFSSILRTSMSYFTVLQSMQ